MKEKKEKNNRLSNSCTTVCCYKFRLEDARYNSVNNNFIEHLEKDEEKEQFLSYFKTNHLFSWTTITNLTEENKELKMDFIPNRKEMLKTLIEEFNEEWGGLPPIYI